jgi:parallel beta-helix repeat protein
MKTKKEFTITIFICIILLFFFLSNPCMALISSVQRTGQTLYVCSNGSTRYSSIQQAIQEARPGDTIYIYNGTYHENIQITKSITLLGEHKQSTILQPLNEYLNYIMYISADNVTISGITIQTIKQNIFNAGILLENSENITITNNTIQNCNQGIVLWQNTTHTSIFNNNFINNSCHIYDNGKKHFFNTSYPLGGNYWDDYIDSDDYNGIKQNLVGSDGIYDTSYNISTSAQKDFYSYVHKDGWQNTAAIASIHERYIGYVHQPINFDGSKSKVGEAEVKYHWDFGDTVTAVGKSCTHTYTKSGTYPITLTLSDGYNNPNTTTSYAYIWDETQGDHISYATYDSYISQRNENQSYGSDTCLKVSNSDAENISEYHHQSLLYFNLSYIPQLIQINHVSLFLYFYQSNSNNSYGRNLSVRRITSQWQHHNVTWFNRPSNSSENTTISSVPQQFGWMSWNVTKDVISFIKRNETNFGWTIMDLEAWGKNNIPLILFKSKETITSYQPYLRINYSTPLLAYTSKVYEASTGEEIMFNGSYIGYASVPLQWNWDFGEGNTSKYQNALFSYDKAGEYLISLTVNDNAGKTSTCTAMVFVTEKNSDCVVISSPLKGFYLFNNKIISLRNTIVFGHVDIVVTVCDNDTLIEKIEFYCNNHLKYTLYEMPFVYRWEKQTILPFRNSIKIIAHKSDDTMYMQEFFVFRFL